MKRIFRISVVLLALLALAQTVALAKVKTGETTDSIKSTGPGI